MREWFACGLRAALAALPFALLVAPSAAWADSFAVAVPMLAAAPHMNGTIDATWSKAVKLPVLFDFTFLRSGEPTSVLVAQDPTGLDFAFAVAQREPSTASQQTNGAGVLSDDNVTVQLWPQGASGFGYTFSANALGARYQTSSENSAYAPQWIASGRRTGTGYAVTMHVPFDVIRSGGSTAWRAQFERTTIANDTTQVWEYAQGQRQAADPAFAGTLTGIAARAQAKATRPKPRLQIYALGEATTPAYGGNTSRMGADVSIPVTPTSSFIGAFHPDYSNVEIDQQTISPSAFARRYAEVRPFFTQAGSFYNNTFSCNNCVTSLYTPAIPTFRQGYAYEGTQGPFSFAAFDAIGKQRTDDAQVLTYSVENPRLIYQASAQRVAVHFPGFDDDVTTLATGVGNQHTHFIAGFNAGTDAGSNITDFELGSMARVQRRLRGQSDHGNR